MVRLKPAAQRLAETLTRIKDERGILEAAATWVEVWRRLACEWPEAELRGFLREQARLAAGDDPRAARELWARAFEFSSSKPTLVNTTRDDEDDAELADVPAPIRLHPQR